jgi:uncharacterized BrkB/YihY/UPF0761 family membrane protein
MGYFTLAKTTLGAGIALMVWLYWTGFAMLVGAELNAELAKISSAGKVEEKHEPPAITSIDFAARVQRQAQGAKPYHQKVSRR